MDALVLMKKFGDRLRESEKELTRLEKRARTIKEKHDTAAAERTNLEQQAQDRETAIVAAQEAREALLQDWTRASFEDDTEAQQDIRQRKSDLDKSIETLENELDTVKERLSGLEDHTRELAEIYLAVEELSFGAAYLFATQLRTELVGNEVRLKSRQSQARDTLPTVPLDVLEAVKADNDPEYLEKKQARAEELEAARQYRMRNESETRERVNTMYRGPGQGGPRAMTQKEATEKLRS